MDLGIGISLAALILAASQGTLILIGQRSASWKTALDQCLKDLERCEDERDRVRDENEWLRERSRRPRSARPAEHGEQSV
jgi:hypothetical protein